jgi:hypothetical protein
MMMRIGEIHSISLNVAHSTNMMIEQPLKMCELICKTPTFADCIDVHNRFNAIGKWALLPR